MASERPDFQRGDTVCRRPPKDSTRASYRFVSKVLSVYRKLDARGLEDENAAWLVDCQSLNEPGLVHCFAPDALDLVHRPAAALNAAAQRDAERKLLERAVKWIEEHNWEPTIEGNAKADAILAEYAALQTEERSDGLQH